MFPQLAGVHNVFQILNVKENEAEETVRLTDRLEFHFLELGKLDDKKPVSEMSSVEKVAAYLEYAGDEAHESYTQELLNEGGKEIAMIEHVFKELTADEIAREIRISEELAEMTRRTQESLRMERLEAEVKERVTQQVTEQVTQQVTEQITQQVTEQITGQVLDRVNRLNQMLAEQGRIEDLVKATSNPKFQEKLMAEFGLVPEA